MATEHRLAAPLTEPQVRGLRAGDSVTLDGIVYGLRDATLIRMFDQDIAPPTDLTGAVVLHTAPNVRRGPDGTYLPLSVGTTTSMRMDRFTRPLLARHGVRAIIGKGGLSSASLAAFRDHGGAYLAITGGAAALETVQIEAIEAVWWEDLMPECLWRFRVRGLGPLIVGMDTHGGDLYAAALAEAKSRLAGIYAKLGL
ncbi:MAG TPA: fumarate hydratase C-terminal domain-containing protein [Methylomirabilota bacterium]|jgi:L(+)-tartrate dehydratase beta subunit|nr:fumarate hydratase C-terminal domain-containing protein [Methylomirabilota bacterium]